MAEAKIPGYKVYSRLRRYLEPIYLYGFYGRSNIESAGIGGEKDYDTVLPALRKLFDREYDEIRKGKNKYPRLKRYYETSGQDELVDVYTLYSMTEKQMTQAIGIMRVLQDDEGSQKARADSDERRYIDKLISFGYLQKRKTDRLYYSFRDSKLKDLDEEELLQLLDYVRFSRCITYPRVPGRALERTLLRKLHDSSCHEISPSPFLIRHNVKRVIFDENALFYLAECIRDRACVDLELRYPGSREISTTRVLPIMLRADVRLGRWYLLCVEKDCPRILRVSSIQELAKAEAVTKQAWETAKKETLEAFTRVGFSGENLFGEPFHVEVKLAFDHAPGMKAQFRREIRLGQIESREDGEYYCVDIKDPQELIPFLRSYAPWLRIQPGADGLKERIERDLLEMKQALLKSEV